MTLSFFWGFVHLLARVRSRGILGQTLNVMPMSAFDDLIKALHNADYATAQRLVDEGVNLDQASGGMPTLFHQQMVNGRFEQARWLAERGADINAVDANGDTSLMFMIERNRFSDFMVAKDMGVSLEKANSQGVTPVLRAALFAHGTPFLKELLKAGVDPNVPSELGNTALLAAASEDFLESLQLLFDHGADPRAINSMGQGIFHACVAPKVTGERNVKILKLVLDQTEGLRASGELDVDQAAAGSTALGIAAQMSYEMVLLLVRAGANPNARDKNTISMGMSPLMLVAHADCDGEAAWVKELLEAGANPSVRDNAGRSVAFYAIASAAGLYGKRAVLEALIEAGLDPKAPLDCAGNSPLHQALMYEQPVDEQGQPSGPTRTEVIEMLIDMGFPTSPRALPAVTREETPLAPHPLICALATQQEDSAAVLIQRGGDLNELNRDGLSVLHGLAVVVGLSMQDAQAIGMVRHQLAEIKQAEKEEEAGKKPKKPVRKPSAEQQAEALRQVEEMEKQGRLVVASTTKVLSEHGADWNVRSSKGLTPAMTIAQDNGVQMLGQIVRFHGADLSLTDDDGLTALDHALLKPAPQVFQALVGHYLNQPDGFASVDQFLINAVNHSPDIDFEDSDSLVVRQKFFELLKTLPPRPELLEARDENGNTPLIVAAATGQDDFIRVLLSMGANPNAQNDAGETAALHGTYEGHSDVVRLLRAAGADMDIASHSGARPGTIRQGREGAGQAALMDPNPGATPEPIVLNEKLVLQLERERKAWDALIEPENAVRPARRKLTF